MSIDIAEEPLFAADDASARPQENAVDPPWNVLVVDDEDDVHAVTRLVLGDFEFNGRRIRLLHAFSAAEARRVISEVGDVALVLLDVVMETDDAGLRLVEYIRNELGNRIVRIVLRTGQPGQAPERRVIRDYDINDYKSKAELTAMKLYTTALTALRSYEDIVAVEASRRGLEKILAAASSLFQTRSMELFASGVLTQISALLGVSREGILCVYQGGLGKRSQEDIYILASSGGFDRVNGALLDNALEPDIADSIVQSMREKESIHRRDSTTLYFETPNERRVVVFLRTGRSPSDLQKQLVGVFCKQVSIGLDNLHMFEELAVSHEELKKAHLATVVTLADVAEMRDPDTGAHVLRVAQTSQAIARALQPDPSYAPFIDDAFIEAIGLASVMHDLGKITTPDRILRKPEKLDDNERAIMQRHASTGQALLEKACSLAPTSRYLQMGAEIAGGHHEWWDGSGYPRGIGGYRIPLSARIVAIADVFDALTHARVYKEAWSHESALEYITERSGSQFDPEIVQAFFATPAAAGGSDEGLA